MAVKRGGLGKGLDSLIPDHKTVKTTEKKKAGSRRKKKKANSLLILIK